MGRRSSKDGSLSITVKERKGWVGVVPCSPHQSRLAGCIAPQKSRGCEGDVPCEKDKNKLSGSFFHIAFTTPHLLAWSEALRLNKTDERKKYE